MIILLSVRHQTPWLLSAVLGTVSLLFPLMLHAQTEGRMKQVPVLPSEAVIKGTVIESGRAPAGNETIETDRILYQVILKVESIRKNAGSSEIIRRKMRPGEHVTLYTKDPSLELAGEKIEAVVVFRGDEKGGRFWLIKSLIVDSKGR